MYLIKQNVLDCYLSGIVKVENQTHSREIISSGDTHIEHRKVVEIFLFNRIKFMRKSYWQKNVFSSNANKPIGSSFVIWTESPFACLDKYVW